VFSSSNLTKKYDEDMLARALESYPSPVQQDENTLLFTTKITGGYALWQEDIGYLNRLRKEMKKSVFRLTTVNAVLAAEEKIKQAIYEKNAKKQLMEQLETELTGYITKLSAFIEQHENMDEVDRPKGTARIAILLCFIKRRCNLFFRERETSVLQADELGVLIDELAEIANYSNVKMIVTNELTTQIPARRVTLFYDFFYNAVDNAAELDCRHMLAHLKLENDSIVMRLLTSEDIGSRQAKDGLNEAIASAGGIYAIKYLDDAVGISLTFPIAG
jgi:hypothetical protein